MKRRFLAWLLCTVMLFNNALPVFATEDGVTSDIIIENTETTSENTSESTADDEIETTASEAPTEATEPTSEPTSETTEPETEAKEEEITSSESENTSASEETSSETSSTAASEDTTAASSENTSETTTEAAAACTECGLTDGHLETCSQYVPEIPVCGICGTYNQETDSCNCVICEECGANSTNNEPHADDCSNKPCEHCEQVGNHAEGCPALCICGDEHNASDYNCPLFEGPRYCECDYDIETLEHESGCHVPVAALHKKLMKAETAEEMFTIFMQAAEEKIDVLFALTFDEIESLRARVNELDPDGEDEYAVELLINFEVLPNNTCPDCGGTGMHEENCPWVLGKVFAENWGPQTITTNTTKILTGNITLTGTIIVDNVTLTIKLADSVNSDVKIIKGFTSSKTYSPMFHIKGENAKLIITGAEAKRIIIDGGNNFNLIPKDSNTDVVPTIVGSGIYVDSHGDLDLDYVTFQNLYTGKETNTSTRGSAIHMVATSTSSKDTNGVVTWSGFNTNTVTMDNVNVKDCLNRNGYSVLYIYGNVTMNNCNIVNSVCDSSYAGVIKAGGAQHYCNLTMNDCVLSGNYSSGWGGAILWACGGNGSIAKINNSIFDGNKAKYLGGAISVEGNVELSGCMITNNEAMSGGGIATFPFTLDTGDSGYNNACGLVLKSGNIISNNHSTGTELDKYDNGGFIPEFIDEPAEGKKDTRLRYPIGGGGIWCYMMIEKWSCSLTIGEGNTIENNSSEIIGGGVLLSKTKGNTTQLIIDGGTVKNNSSVNGAGVAVSNGDFIINKGTITENINATNGGGAYVSGGTFTMNDGTISNNGAENGGGVYVAGGNVDIKHGIINDNSATEDGGAVYLDGDAETTLHFKSGRMNDNYAADDGGAIYATGGTLYIGLENCPGQIRDENTNEVTEQNTQAHIKRAEALGEIKDGTVICKYHPEITGNEAEDVGGAIALAGKGASSGNMTPDTDGTLPGGTVHFYCGMANGNKALYKGVGMNVFMQGGEFHYYQGTNIGEPHDPDLVIIGGDLKNHDTTKEYVYLYYYQNNIDNADADPDFKGMATEDSFMNLPEGEYFWPLDDDADEVFVGWTPFLKDAPDGQKAVRDKDDYKPSGKDVQINDTEEMRTQQNTFDGTEDMTMHLYAVWAPKVNGITYADSLMSRESTSSPADGTASYTIDKGDSQTITIPAANATQHPGFDIVGWYLYQDEGQNANWCDSNFKAYEPVYIENKEHKYENLNYNPKDFTQGGMMYYPVDENGNITLTIDPMTFGDITLVADYALAHSDLTIKKDGCEGIDPYQTFIFDVVGEKADFTAVKEVSDITVNSTLSVKKELDDLKKVDLEVMVAENGSVTITHLPLGKYTVTEDENWSWRYSVDTTKTPSTVEVDRTGGNITVVNTRDEFLWMDGNAWCQNIFDKSLPKEERVKKSPSRLTNS